MNQTLKNIRILDFSHVLAGPFCTQILADMGAEIIKIEPPWGDFSRHSPTHKVDGQTAYFYSTNHGKKSLAVDLTKPDGLNIIYDLVKISSGVIENFRPGKMQSLGLGEGHLKTIKPDISYVSIRGYESTDSRPSYDLISQCLSGIADLNQDRQGHPQKVGVPLGDLVSGLFATIALLGQMNQAGKGEIPDSREVGMLPSLTYLMSYIGQSYLTSGQREIVPPSQHRSTCPSDIFKTQDGALGLHIPKDEFWKDFCCLPDFPELLRFAEMNRSTRVHNREEIHAVIAAAFSKRTNKELLKICASKNIPIADVRKYDDVLQTAQLATQSEIVRKNSTGFFHLKSPVSCAEMSPPPLLGQHNWHILHDILEYDKNKIQSLKEKEVIFD